MSGLTQLLEWPVVEDVIRHSRLVLLYGPPGTGKTTVANHIGLEKKLPVANVTLTDETPSAELRGHWLPGEQWEFVYGPAMDMYTAGGMLVLNEIDKASLDTLDFLHALTDDSDISGFNLPNGKRETVRPGKTFCCCATTNKTPEDLPEALRDRFNASIYIRHPHPEAINSLSEDLREAARNTCGNDEDPFRPFTLRRWKAYDSLRNSIGEENAAIAIFAHRASEMRDALTLAAAR